MSPPPNVGQGTPWIQLSFVLAKDIVERKLHTSYLNRKEAQYLETTVESFATWQKAFTSDNTDPSSEHNVTIFRVRALLYEQIIPSLFNSNHPCCHHAEIDLEQIREKARSFVKMSNDIDPNVSIPSPEQISSSPFEAQSNDLDDEASEPLPIEDIQNIPLDDVYHTLESDYKVMVEQRKLQEYEAQEALNEEEKENAEHHSISMFNPEGNFNLKYLLQGIMSDRNETHLSDRDLQNLLSDFRPNRSKWASDEKIGQEELYEACERALADLKNFTEHSTPFLTRVSKREAPDYFDVIKHPMDLGTMSKKLKQMQYRTKKEFADDLYLIYDNCLLYNINPESEYRKHAVAMRKKTDRLLIRIPEITVRDRSEVEGDDEGEDMSEDEPEENVSRKQISGTHTQPLTSAAPETNDSGSGPSREKPLPRSSSAALMGDTWGSDSESGFMTPDAISNHKTYGGKKPTNQGRGDDDTDGGDERTENLSVQDQAWIDVTKKTRARITDEEERQDNFDFGDREALVRSPFDMGRFSMLEHAHGQPEKTRALMRCVNQRFSHWVTRQRSIHASLFDDFDLNASDEDDLIDAFFSRKIAKPLKPQEDDATRNDLFLPEYSITCGLPEIIGVPEELSLVRSSSSFSAETGSDIGYTNTSLAAYESACIPKTGLTEMIDSNVRTLNQIRKLYTKCAAVRDNASLSSNTNAYPSDSLVPSQYEDPSILASDDRSPSAAIPSPPLMPSLSPDVHPELMPDTLPPLILEPESSYHILKGTVSKLLAHAGFEGAREWALRVLSEVAMDFMANLGKTLRCYCDEYGKSMSEEEMIMHTLYENGIKSVNELDSYICDDVERYGFRLEDVYRRLQITYDEMLSANSDEPDEQDDGMAQDESSFVTGLFGEDIGEDFFGFKDLGLDKEYSLDTLSIPSHLWFGGNKEKDANITLTKKEPDLKYPPPPPFTPLESEKQVIGLLQPLFATKFANGSDALVEDEYLSNRHRNRPRYPPTNKNGGSGRKKMAKDGSGSGLSADKKKRKRPTEEIEAEKAERAEKRRQKLEERAQKQAEKEQKRRIREELREQERTAKLEAKEKKRAMAKKAAKQAGS